jgi:hypothetical protein
MENNLVVPCKSYICVLFSKQSLVLMRLISMRITILWVAGILPCFRKNVSCLLEKGGRYIDLMPKYFQVKYL